MADLRKEDFRILDAGKPQTLLAVGHEEVPLEIVLLLDARSNMLRIVERLGAATQLSLSGLRQSDRVAIVGFHEDCQTTLVSDFTNDATALERAIRTYLAKNDPPVRTHGFCQPMKALRASAQVFQGQQETNRRRSIVGISDDRGAGTNGDLVRQGIHDLWSADAVVLSLGVKSDLKEFHVGPAFRGMRFAASQTGGEVVGFDDAPEGLRDAIRRLRSRYSLFYALPHGVKPGEERKIRVELMPEAASMNKNAVVRSRSGYVVPSVEGPGAR